MVAVNLLQGIIASDHADQWVGDEVASLMQLDTVILEINAVILLMRTLRVTLHTH